MARMWITTFVILGFVQYTYGKPDPTPETRLMKDLLTNYNSNIRPMYSPNEKMTVHVTFSLKRIENLDEKHQILHSFGWVAMTWTDEILQWNPLDYNNTYRVVVGADKIWMPEMAMFNSVNQGNDLSLDVKFRAAVAYDGTVFFAPGFKWSTECKVDLLYFPFDKQTCNLTFVNWVYSGRSLVFKSNGVQLFMYEKNDEWTLLNATANSQLRTADADGNMVIPEVYFTVELERKPMYYIVNVLVPSFMISLLSCLVFLLPSDAGEKVSMAITVLLAYTILLLMVSDITPKSGLTQPHITLFIIISMGMTALSLILTVIILNLYHHHGNKPVPACVNDLVLRGMGSLVCMRGELGLSKVTPIDTEGSLVSMLRRSNVTLQDLEQKKNLNDSGLPDDVITYIRYLMEKDQEKEQEELYKSQWIGVAKVLDRFMLYLSLLVITIGIMGFMLLVTRAI